MDYLIQHFDRIWELLREHFILVFVSLIISLVVATILTVVVNKISKIYTPVIVILGLLYTIPSLALFALMIPIFGLGVKPALIALVMYSQMTLVRNMVSAVRAVDPAIIEAARGMGMSSGKIFRQIILPLAMPVIIAGVRIATVMMIGITVIAAYINAGGLGELIFEGLAQDHKGKILAGTIAVAFVSILADFVFRMIERTMNRAAWRRG
ncbi:ABC transporter permease [Paenibacillus eucommiae]|uniref:Osmoprotectant transport system permease protein n=1 Tax=Paenibacillus eucommiae TaxID=1355755 RepID=A0ABS4J5S3_9BACL|nr:ABC transporter permease [Paenibacillus eucommiae]MBP1995183.1 osmoprotectant transport system permease protein [Paenibacillus eucommiae]